MAYGPNELNERTLMDDHGLDVGKTAVTLMGWEMRT